MNESDGGSFTVSQGLEVVPPRSGRALAIPQHDWEFLKNKLSKLSDEPWFFMNLGWTMTGAGLATLIALLSGVPPESELEHRHIAMVCCVSLLLIGCLCLLFAKMQRKDKKNSVAEVCEYMDLVESRYETATRPSGIAPVEKWAILPHARTFKSFLEKFPDQDV
jgi:hypothetical protein